MPTFKVPDNIKRGKIQPSPIFLILGKVMGLWDALLLLVLKGRCFNS